MVVKLTGVILMGERGAAGARQGIEKRAVRFDRRGRGAVFEEALPVTLTTNAE